MNSAKRRAIILMVLGATIGVVAVGVYFLQDDTTPLATDTPPTATSTPSIFDMEPIIPEAKVSTEGWKTCRNEEYGYEFQFPGEWKIYGEDALNDAPVKRSYVRESEECNGIHVMLSTVEPWSGKVFTEKDGGFHVSVSSSTLDKSAYWDDFLTKHDNNKSQLVYMLVDGRSAILQLYNLQIYKKGNWGIEIFYDQNVYKINRIYYKEQSPVILTILSTFRFLDTATTSEEVVTE